MPTTRSSPVLLLERTGLEVRSTVLPEAVKELPTLFPASLRHQLHRLAVAPTQLLH
jgi:hypothetical protein